MVNHKHCAMYKSDLCKSKLLAIWESIAVHNSAYAVRGMNRSRITVKRMCVHLDYTSVNNIECTSR